MARLVNELGGLDPRLRDAELSGTLEKTVLAGDQCVPSKCLTTPLSSPISGACICLILYHFRSQNGYKIGVLQEGLVAHACGRSPVRNLSPMNPPERAPASKAAKHGRVLPDDIRGTRRPSSSCDDACTLITLCAC